MKFNYRFLSLFSTLIIIIFISSCKQNDSNNGIQDASKTIESSGLSIDTFSFFPPEIDGCSCYFSNDSSELKGKKYVYMNDYNKISFLKINGVLTKFTQTDFKQIDSTKTISKSENDEYEIKIEIINGIQNGDETWLKNATINLVDKKNGNIITKKLYGECGC